MQWQRSTALLDPVGVKLPCPVADCCWGKEEHLSLLIPAKRSSSRLAVSNRQNFQSASLLSLSGEGRVLHLTCHVFCSEDVNWWHVAGMAAAHWRPTACVLFVVMCFHLRYVFPWIWGRKRATGSLRWALGELAVTSLCSVIINDTNGDRRMNSKWCL